MHIIFKDFLILIEPKLNRDNLAPLGLACFNLLNHFKELTRIILFLLKFDLRNFLKSVISIAFLIHFWEKLLFSTGSKPHPDINDYVTIFNILFNYVGDSKILQYLWENCKIFRKVENLSLNSSTTITYSLVFDGISLKLNRPLRLALASASYTRGTMQHVPGGLFPFI